MIKLDQILKIFHRIQTMKIKIYSEIINAKIGTPLVGRGSYRKKGELQDFQWSPDWIIYQRKNLGNRRVARTSRDLLNRASYVHHYTQPLRGRIYS